MRLIVALQQQALRLARFYVTSFKTIPIEDHVLQQQPLLLPRLATTQEIKQHKREIVHKRAADKLVQIIPSMRIVEETPLGRN